MKRWLTASLVWVWTLTVLLAPALASDNREPDKESQGRSLLGKSLIPPELSPEVYADRMAKLRDARRIYEKDPSDAEAIIWLGRRTAYLGNYREAIEIYSRGIELHPTDARLYRHRGHRYLSVRELDLAISDLDFAASLIYETKDTVEPDGLPNKRNIPTSTLHTNIWYHLGLGLYLQGNFKEAVEAYSRCREASKNPDMLAATVNWLWHTLMRLGATDEARTVLDPINAEMEIIENESYRRLCLLYKGELAPEALSASDDDPLENATLGYGIANWYLVTGNPGQAETTWRKILEGSQWAAFGYIAAEADLARLGITD